MDRCCQSKGTNFHGFIQAAANLYPDVTQDQLLATSPAEMRQRISDGTLLTSDWYPVTWYNTLHQGLRQATGRDAQVCWDIGYEATRMDFAEGGIYRHIVRLLSPNTMFSLGQKIFGLYWKPGRLTTHKLSKKKARGHWSQCEGFTEDTWQDLLGSTVRVLQLTGAHEPTLHVVAGGRSGDPFMEAEATWL